LLFGARDNSDPAGGFGIIPTNTLNGLKIYAVYSDINGSDLNVIRLGDTGTSQSGASTSLTVQVQGYAVDTVIYNWVPGNSRYELVDAMLVSYFIEVGAQKTSLDILASFVAMETNSNWSNSGTTSTLSEFVELSDGGIVRFTGATVPDQAVIFGNFNHTDGYIKSEFKSELLFNGASNVSPSFFMAMRITDENNFVGIRSFNGLIELYERIGGVASILAAVANPPIGTTLRMELVADEVIVYFDGVQSLFGTTTWLTPGGVGVIVGNWLDAAVDIIDGFKVVVFRG